MTKVPPTRLGYMIVESEKFDEWEVFLRDGIGAHVDRFPNEIVMRLDDRERRMVIRRGPAEDVVSLGFELDTPKDLEAMRAHLASLGEKPVDGDEAALRAVDSFFTIDGPKGLAIEFFAGGKRTNRPLAMISQGFSTGPGGLGHAVLFSKKPEALVTWLQERLGARITDRITDKLQGIEMEFTFLHLNERHHSVAVAATKGLRLDPIRTRIQHMMIEAESLDDVGDAYLRCKEMGYRIALGMGQHPNDKGLSFYVVTPSGFEFELGADPVRIGEDWEVKDYRGISKWGHKPEFRPEKKEKAGQLWTVVKSLFRRS